jgi:hypothetical protein
MKHGSQALELPSIDFENMPVLKIELDALLPRLRSCAVRLSLIKRLESTFGCSVSVSGFSKKNTCSSVFHPTYLCKFPDSH